MNENIIFLKKLEEVLKKNWTSFFNNRNLLLSVLKDAKNIDLKISKQKNCPPQNIKVLVTNFKLLSGNLFEICVEFTVPKDNGVIIGAHIYSLCLEGNLKLINSFGTLIIPDND